MLLVAVKLLLNLLNYCFKSASKVLLVAVKML